MGFFQDLFGQGSQDAAQAQINAANAAYGAATPFFNTARGNITDYGTKALAPYTGLFGTGTQGLGAYGTAVGLGGDPTATLNALRNTPGYEFALTQGLQGVDRGAAARTGGSLYSGNTLGAEQQFGQGLADQTYQNYVRNLAPYMGLAETGAGGISNVNTGIGGNLAGINLNQGNMAANTQLAIGNATAAGDLARQNTALGVAKGVGNLAGTLLGFV